MANLQIPAKACIMGMFSSLGKCGVQTGDHDCKEWFNG